MLDDTHCVRPIPDLSSMRSVDQSDQSSSTTTFDVQDCPYACVCTGDWADCSFKNNNHRKFFPFHYQISIACSGLASVPSILPKYVTHLDMHDQGVTMMSDDICVNKEKLEEIILDSNQINGISDDAFRSCKGLKHLKLSRNQIYDLAGSLFRPLSSLESIDLSENQLTKIPDGAFDGMTMVERVDLRENYISSISERAFEGLTSMRFLYLERNRLSTIDVNWINRIGSLSGHLDIIFLNQNDIQCDCKMKPLGDALHQLVTPGKRLRLI